VQAPAPAPALKPEPEPEPPPPPGLWYGGQTLGVDLGAVVLLIVGGALAASSSNTSAGDALLAIGSATYVLGPPIVHLTHGRPGVAAGDLGLRLGAPVAGVLAGGFFGLLLGAGGGSDDAAGIAVIVGGIAGTAFAVAIDAAVFAREPKPAPVAMAHPPPFALSIAPTLLMVRGDREQGLTPVPGVVGTF